MPTALPASISVTLPTCLPLPGPGGRLLSDSAPAQLLAVTENHTYFLFCPWRVTPDDINSHTPWSLPHSSNTGAAGQKLSFPPTGKQMPLPLVSLGLKVSGDKAGYQTIASLIW
ncbi:hypothetical protein H1C71_035927 [Ictidomys tridecemlineatus]|nr:hypothetical protein H1C71_035927 [Ictidomys tridecemlineatus]